MSIFSFAVSAVVLSDVFLMPAVASVNSLCTVRIRSPSMAMVLWLRSSTCADCAQPERMEAMEPLQALSAACVFRTAACALFSLVVVECTASDAFCVAFFVASSAPDSFFSSDADALVPAASNLACAFLWFSWHSVSFLFAATSAFWY